MSLLVPISGVSFTALFFLYTKWKQQKAVVASKSSECLPITGSRGDTVKKEEEYKRVNGESTGKARCPKGHPLIKHYGAPSDYIQSHERDNIEVSCDICSHQSIQRGYLPVYHCAECGYDVCFVCMSSQNSDPVSQGSIINNNAIVDTEDNEMLLGVKFSYFETFILENGGWDMFEDKTTAEINEMLLIPICRDNNDLSVCQQLYNRSSSYVGKPTWFISHAWSYKFLDVVDAVGLTLRRVEGEDKYRDTVVWFDQFTLVHPAPPSLPYDVLHDTFMNSTKQIGRMILVFDKWDNPAHLTRAWCVFEAYACLATSSVLEVAMTQAETANFLNSVQIDHHIFYQMLTKIDTRKSDARYEEDRDTIHRAISEKIDGGFTQLDRRIFVELEKWMVNLLQRQIERVSDIIQCTRWKNVLANLYSNSGKLDPAESLFVESMSIFRQMLGDDSLETIVTINNLALVYKNQGKFDQAEQLYLESLSALRRLMGDESSGTLIAINNLGNLYDSQGKYDLAEPLYADCLATSRRVLGNEHMDTLTSIGNLAFLYKSQGKYDQAEPLMLECVETQSRVLGEDHPSTLITIGNLATMYEAQGKYTEAEILHEKCLTTSRRVLGEEHSSTLICINNLGALHVSQRKFDLAEPLILECVAVQRRILGDDHPSTLTSLGNLAFLYKSQGKYEEAEPVLSECVETQRRKLGDEHPSTLISINNMAALYESKGMLDEAETMYADCLATRRRVLGDEHPDTLTSVNGLANTYTKQQRYQEAEILYTECIEKRKRVLGSTHPRTVENMGDYVDMLEAAGLIDRAKLLRDELSTLSNKSH